jgi:predicted AlkP superfamily phosphohydrolase/phosphomutase
MKILVLGLDGADPELLLGDPRLENIRRLMDSGWHGRLESVIPCSAVPAWMSMATGQDPGSLGVYGRRHRLDHPCGGQAPVDLKAIAAPAVWDHLARRGGRSILIGVPRGYPARRVNGIAVRWSSTLDSNGEAFNLPARIRRELAALVGADLVAHPGARTGDKARLRDRILAMTRAHFRVARHLLANYPWDYFQLLEAGLGRIQHAFWSHHDPRHVGHEPDSPFGALIRNYYRLLDEEIGTILELLSDETIVLVVSAHGARRLDGGFCVNEWLVREGLLALNSYPARVTPFGRLDVDWEATRAWSTGGCAARVYLNVKGREPRGVVAGRDYEAFRDEIKARLEATTDAEGRPLGTLVFRPKDIYRDVRNVAPDLIVYFGGLAWRAIGGVGYRSCHVGAGELRAGGCNHDQHGAFLLAAPNLPGTGSIEGAHLLDIAPTVLELGGHDIPRSMPGRSLAAGRAGDETVGGYTPLDEEIVRGRLSGLGYIS